MDTQIPCIDCITLSICNSIFTSKEHYSDFLGYIYIKCSLVRQYLRFPQTGTKMPDLDSNAIMEITQAVQRQQNVYDYFDKRNNKGKHKCY